MSAPISLAVITASVVGIHAFGAHLDVFGEHGTIVGPLSARHDVGADERRQQVRCGHGRGRPAPLAARASHGTDRGSATQSKRRDQAG